MNAAKNGGRGGEGRRPSRPLLQRLAGRNIRAHWLRDVLRVAVLAGSDIAVYVVIRATTHALRGGLLGEAAARTTVTLFPPGFLGSWRFLGAVLLSLLVVGAYGPGRSRRNAGRLTMAAFLAALISLYHPAWSGPITLVLVQFVTVGLVFGLGLTAFRAAVNWCVCQVRAHFEGASRTILIARRDADWRDLGVVLDRTHDFVLVDSVFVGPPEGPDEAAKLHELGRIVSERSAETVLMWGDFADDEFAQVVDVALTSGCRLLAAQRTRTSVLEPRGVWVGGKPLVELTVPRLRAGQLALKRILDLIGAVVGLVVAAPVFVLIASAVWLESGRPIFFRQERVGRAGRTFRILKFRSMVNGAEAQRDGLRRKSIYGDARLFKVPDDPRITRVGRFLRKASLDELPQLLNVLVGDMSLVGPRPPIPSEVANYDEPHYCRFDVKPGITGPWQVSGRNTISDFEHVVKLENEYIRTWSILADIRILAKTVPVVLRWEGAY